MSAKKTTNKSQRKYHADGFTYDQKKKSFTLLNAEDPSRKEMVRSTLRLGGVGPETPELHKKRINERIDYLHTQKGERFTADGKRLVNKARGTQSSTTRKLIK
jgi:hypothetical protein